MQTQVDSEEQELAAQLRDSDLRTRLKAVMGLMSSFSDEIGDKLTEVLIDEHNRYVFGLLCKALIPRQIVKLHNRLEKSDPTWPFDAERTSILVRAVRDWTFPFVDRRLPQLLTDESWAVRLVAVEHCRSLMRDCDLCYAACDQFLITYSGNEADNKRLAVFLNQDTFDDLVAHIREIHRELKPGTGSSYAVRSEMVAEGTV